MQVRLFRREDRKYLVLLFPSTATGVETIVADEVARKDIEAVVLPVAQKEEEVRARMKAARDAIPAP